MPDGTVTPLRPRAAAPYTDTAALNDIHALLTATEPGQSALKDIALILARTGRPMTKARDIAVSTIETALGWPVACVDAGDTNVYVRQDPAGEGLLIEICTETDAEASSLTVTLDGTLLRPVGPATASRLTHPGPPLRCGPRPVPTTTLRRIPMSDLPEVTPDAAAETGSGEYADPSAQPRAEYGRLIPVSELTAHPGNVRQDLELTPEFCASIASEGVRVPLLVTYASDGTYRVIEGHRRLAAAMKTGLEAIPCDVDPDRAVDEAGQYLDMALANGGGYRRNFTVTEETAALFAAHEAGASKTRLRKATGRKAEEIKTVLKVAQISEDTRTAVGDLARQLDLESLALLAEFDGDPGAVSQILDALHRGYNVEYQAERIRQQRAEAAGHQQLLDDLQTAGVQITTDLPAGAARLSQLLHDGEDLTPQTHGSCPGRGAFFYSWALQNPVYYCASPDEHGHTFRTSQSAQPPTAGGPTPDAGDGGTPQPGTSPVPAGERPDPARRLVIEGNKAWQAAAEVRKRWLADTLFARRAAPREAAQFIARQLLAMPEPLRTGLSIAPGRVIFTEVARQDASKWLEICATTAAARLPLLMLAPIAVTYEYAMTQGEGRNTWRTDNRYSPCPRTQAGEYLAFLASIGHTLTPIEQAVTDSVPWTGDTPAEDPLPAEDSQPGTDDARDTTEATAA